MSGIDASRWPDGRRMALVITVDFFDDAAILTQEPRMAGRDKSLSVWRYGAVRGVDRLLEVFDETGIAASWFVPGCVALRHRELVRRIHRAGHEVGNATFACEDFDAIPLTAQRDSVERAQQTIGEVIGESPVGFRAPFGNWSRGFTDVLEQGGFSWSSSWRGDHLPYFHCQPGAARDRRIVELPLHYELEDEPYFAFNLYPPVPSGQPRIAPYRDVLANWQQDFDGFHRFGLCLPLRIHPEILGTAGRIQLVRDFLAHARSRGGVWIAQGREVARWWNQQRDANEPGHPVDLFGAYRPPGAAPVR